MVYNIDEREMSMEYLLQDLESECPGLTLHENTTQHSFDVVETTTDTLDVSSDHITIFFRFKKVRQLCFYELIK